MRSRGALPMLSACQLPVARNQGQQIVEIVRHPARQPAQRFHFARLHELTFERPPLRDIDADAAHERRFAVFENREFIDQPQVRTVFVRHRLHHFKRLSTRHHERVVGAIMRRVFGGPQLFVGLANDFIRLLPEQPPRRFVVVDVLAAYVFDERDAGQMAHERCEALLALPHRLFPQLALGDIDDRRHQIAAHPVRLRIEHAHIHERPAAAPGRRAAGNTAPARSAAADPGSAAADGCGPPDRNRAAASALPAAPPSTSSPASG